MLLLWNSANENVSGKNLSNFNKNWIGVDRRGNNWIEPLREWIKTAFYAEKIALSKDFMEIKSLVEKIGTNRRLLDRKILFRLRPFFDLVPKYKGFGERNRAKAARSEPSFVFQKSESQLWSGWADLNRRSHAPHACALDQLGHTPPRNTKLHLNRL